MEALEAVLAAPAGSWLTEDLEQTRVALRRRGGWGRAVSSSDTKRVFCSVAERETMSGF